MNPPDEIGVEETGGSGAPAPEKIFLPPRASGNGPACLACTGGANGQAEQALRHLHAGLRFRLRRTRLDERSTCCRPAEPVRSIAARSGKAAGLRSR